MKPLIVTLLYFAYQAASLECFAHSDCQHNTLCVRDYTESNSCVSKSLIEEILERQVQSQEPVIQSLVQIKNNQCTTRIGAEQRFALKTGRQGEVLQINLNNQNDVVSLTNDRDELAIQNNGKELARFKSNLQASFSDLYIASIVSIAKKMMVNGYAQWQTYTRDDFSILKDKMQWNGGTMGTNNCGGVTMLGGPGLTSTQTLTRSFTNLPPHTEIRIKFFYHYIDSWTGQVGYLKTSRSVLDKNNTLVKLSNVRWTEPYDFTDGKRGANICGDPSVDENKFTYFADVQFPHNIDNIEVEVGSTLVTDPGFSSFGISSFSLFLI